MHGRSMDGKRMKCNDAILYNLTRYSVIKNKILLGQHLRHRKLNNNIQAPK